MLQVFRNNSAFAPIARGSINRLDALFPSSLYQNLVGDDGGFLTQAWSRFPVAMWQDEDRIYIEAELPGVAEEDVNVTVHNNVLFIRGERKPAEGREYLYDSRSYGRFERAITLPEPVATDDVRAALTHGVLFVDFAKAPEAKPKKIGVKAI
jgi:HSP20 family protein